VSGFRGGVVIPAMQLRLSPCKIPKLKEKDAPAK